MWRDYRRTIKDYRRTIKDYRRTIKDEHYTNYKEALNAATTEI